MHMTTTPRLLAALALLTSSLALAQAPQKIAYQGLLLKSDGTPETGTVAIKFSIFNQATNGTELWTETQSAVALTQGFYATTLGEGTAFPNALFDGTERFLELSIAGSPLNPRMKVVAVPYAISAGTATSVNGGTVNASAISIGGNPVIDSSGNLVGTATYQGANGVSITGRTIGLVPGCQAGETLKWSGAPTNAWQCAAGAPAATDGGVVAYTADPDGGLQLTGSNFTAFSLLRSCTANQLLKWSGSAWVCADDSTGTTYNIAAGQGLALTGAQSNLFGLQNCTAGQVLKSGGGNWACQGDNDTTYIATVNHGLLLTGTGFGLDACPSGQVMKSQGTGNWACAADDSATYDVIASGGLRRVGTTFGIGSCASGEIMKSTGSGFWSCQADNNSLGTVTQITAGSGLTTGGSPITSTGTLSLLPTVPNWTAASAANCAPGNALRAIGTDGTPTCVSIAGGGTVLQITAGNGIITSPDAGITTTGSIAVAPTVQNWPTQPSCPAGQAIQGLSVTGAPNCITVSLDGGGGGGGSVTSVGTGAGLTGGPITGSGIISVPNNGITNAMLVNNGVTVSAGTGLTGGGPVALGGSITLGLSTPVSAANGGTGITGPTLANQFLKSTAPGVWSVGTIAATDVPDVSSTYGYVTLAGTQTISGSKTFSSVINGNLNGNATTATNGVVTTGSYADPAWITSLAGSKITGAISGNAAGFTGNLSGDVTGAQASTTVARIRGTTVVATAPGNGQALMYNGSNLQYEPTSMAGDVTGALNGNTVTRIRNTNVSTTAPAGGQVLAYNNALTQWQPTSITATAPIAISGTAISLTTCANGQVYKYVGSPTNAWQCAADDNAVTGATANGGLVLTGTTLGLTTCANNQVLKYDTTAPAGWVCSGVNNLMLTNNSVTIGTAAASGLTGGGSVTLGGSLALGVNFAGTGSATTVSRSDHTHTEGDGVIGNEVTAATNSTLTRSGTGTSVDPYTLGLNLSSANTWQTTQTFLGNAQIPGTAFLDMLGTSTIRFNATGTISAPMIMMYPNSAGSGIRPVIGHSSSFQEWGMAYDDGSDAFRFQQTSASVPAAYIDVNQTRMAVAGNSGSFVGSEKLNVQGSTYLNGALTVNSSITANGNTQVNGNVGANNYLLNSTKTGAIFIPGSAFSADNDDDTYELSTSSGYGYVNGTASPFDIGIASTVQLPNGVTITGFSCFTYDASAGDLGGTMSLKRRTLSSTGNTTLTSVSIATTGTPGYETKTSLGISSVVDNLTYGYYLATTISETTNTSFGYFYGCQVFYTYTSIQL
jgi:hypothetical protein